jgi:hypothetical protein
MTTTSTDPVLLAEVGPPPWAEIEGQRSCKYASIACAHAIALPWVRSLVDRMIGTLPSADRILVDVRWWPDLRPGDLPGLPDWHFDCYNDPDAPQSAGEEHRLYFAGAGCRTMFWPDLRPPEGWILGYPHTAKHRVMPATVAGPRLLVRVSQAAIRPRNLVRPPPLFRGRG